ncbi:MAG: hypothetical protein ACM3UU_06685 [Ignavibacteriales bacterium]
MISNNIFSILGQIAIAILFSVCIFIFQLPPISAIILFAIYIGIGYLLKSQNSSAKNFLSISALGILLSIFAVYLFFTYQSEIVNPAKYFPGQNAIIFALYIILNPIIFSFSMCDPSIVLKNPIIMFIILIFISFLPTVLMWIGLQLKFKLNTHSKVNNEQC